MLPFLSSQKLYLLKPDVDSRAALHPERFHAARQRREGPRSEEPAQPDSDSWVELPRSDLLDGSCHGQNLHRVALTTDAGLGKSYNLVWLRHELWDRTRRRPTFVLPIGSLGEPADLINKLLVPEIRNVPGNEGETPTRLKADLERLRQRGQIVLLFDGLDQASKECVQSLACLLDPKSDWAGCRMVVAGRPFALERHWDTLFAGSPWQFVQIAEFDSQQQRAALGQVEGRDRYDFLPEEAHDILTIPRVLEYLQPLGVAQLERLKTVADVYWEGCRHMLKTALHGRLNVLTEERYLALLGALAFTMYAWPDDRPGTNLPRPNLDRIPHRDMPEFLRAVRKRLKKVFPDATEKRFLRELTKLSRLNTILHHGWLDVRAVGGTGEDFLWRNASLQEFFAAFWVTRWGDPTDTRRLANWVVDPLTDANRGFSWFWRYACEMPDKAIEPNSSDPPASWLNVMAPLYDGSAVDAQQRSVRSTEFIYRSWPRMVYWQAPALSTFQGEFPAILAGKKGADQRTHAEKWLAGFLPLVKSGKPGDTGTFLMGAPPDEYPAWDGVGENQNNPLHTVALSPYALHRFCVTNEEYELFDPRHRSFRWGREQHRQVRKTGDETADDRCPVVWVQWYDAWCLAKWLGVVQSGGKPFRVALPTEAQWEYACRAGKTTSFTFHKGHDGTTCTHDVCNFDGNYPFPGNTKKTTGVSEEIYRQATLPVDDLKPNPWGFFQMHGNVWEWCEDWFAPGFYRTEEGLQEDPCNSVPAWARVLRGGCWIDRGWFCRSAYRGRCGPAYRYLSIGFRLSAVPVVGAQSGSGA